jgi:hypothetical protein
MPKTPHPINVTGLRYALRCCVDGVIWAVVGMAMLIPFVQSAVAGDSANNDSTSGLA